MNVLELCAGIGGIGLGLERAGATVVGQVEINEWCRRVLAKHWPKVARHGDVRTAVRWWLTEPRPRVDCIATGFPCQPVSECGRRLGELDERWLWPACADVIDAIGPEWVLFENVPGLRTRGLRTVLADLDRLGYRVRVGTLGACAMGAPHTRERLFGVAHSPSRGRGPRGSDRPGPASLEPVRRGEELGGYWAGEPRPGGVAYGVPDRLDRVRAAGNAVVPQVAEHIGRLIIAAHSVGVA